MKLDRNTLRALALVSGIGFSIAAGIILGILGGNWADRALGTYPCGVVAGILLGLALAFTTIYQLVGAFRGPNDKSHGSNRSGPSD